MSESALDIRTVPTVPAHIARSWMLRSPLAPQEPSGCDALVHDLEDGLPSAQKHEGRATAARLLENTPAWIRVNAHGNREWADDLAMASAARGLEGVMLAVTDSAAQVEETAARLPAGTPIVALIESAIGLERVSSIASHPATFRLAFGSGDFRRDTGMADDPIVLSWPRARLVVASAAAGIAAPIDGPTLGDTDAVLAGARHAAAMGMTGKLALQASHASTINEGLSPSPSDITAARELVNRPAGVADGSYAPALARAERTLDRARSFGLL